MTPTNRKKLVLAHSVHSDAPQHEVETNRALARWLAQILEALNTAVVVSIRRSITAATFMCCRPRRWWALPPPGKWAYAGRRICGAVMSTTISSAPRPSAMACSTKMRTPRQAGHRCFPSACATWCWMVSACFPSTMRDPRAEHLIYSGPIRLKPVHACAGRGQEVIDSLDRFDAILARPNASNLFAEGVVLEQDLGNVITHSVGQSFIGDTVLSYCGEQYLIEDGQGRVGVRRFQPCWWCRVITRFRPAGAAFALTMCGWRSSKRAGV